MSSKVPSKKLSSESRVYQYEVEVNKSCSDNVVLCLMLLHCSFAGTLSVFFFVARERYNFMSSSTLRSAHDISE